MTQQATTAQQQPAQDQRDVFLDSDDASYLTGQVLHPNGGEMIITCCALVRHQVELFYQHPA